MRTMKNSGIEWIGEIPAGWKVKKIKHSFSIIAGATPKSEVPEFWDGDIAWITPADYKTADVYVAGGKRNLSQAGYDSCGTTLIPSGSIVFSKRAPIGSVAINTNDLCTNQGCLSCVPRCECVTKYFYYMMSVFTEIFNLFGTGTTFKEISADNFANFSLPFPEITEQHQIVSYLDQKCTEVDAVIAKTKATIEEYKKLKQSIITETVTKGIRGDRSMKESGIEWIGEMPTEWSMTKLSGATLSMRNGYVGPTRDLFFEHGVRYIQSLHIKNGKIDFDRHPYYVSDEWAEVHPKIKTNDILIVQTGDIGQVGIVEDKYDGCNCHALIIATPNSDVVIPNYLKFYLMSFVGRELMLSFRTGALLPHLNAGKIKFTPVVVPSLHEQEEIAEYLAKKCAEIDALIDKKMVLLEELEEYKESVIYEYVTGKKEVV